MIVEHVHNEIRYTLSNENIKVGDMVYPIANGRHSENDGWILHNFNYEYYRSGFHNEPHKILDLKHSDYKPYQIKTDHGYGPIEMYYKIIKWEHRVKVRDGFMGSDIIEWQEI